MVRYIGPVDEAECIENSLEEPAVFELGAATELALGFQAFQAPVGKSLENEPNKRDALN